MQVLGFILILFIGSSCSSIQSGQNVKVAKGDTIQSLSKEFNVSATEIRQANPGKTVREGEWIFIPKEIGILDSMARSEVMSAVQKGEFSWPVPSSKRISSRFGKRWGRKHEGLDIAARSGSHIVAVMDGIVTYAGSGLGGYGKTIVLSHREGVFTVYAHTKKIFVRRGQRIYQGQVIAQVGQSGRASGPHLHFEVRRESKAYDPLIFLSEL